MIELEVHSMEEINTGLDHIYKELEAYQGLDYQIKLVKLSEQKQKIVCTIDKRIQNSQMGRCI